MCNVKVAIKVYIVVVSTSKVNEGRSIENGLGFF